jgi:DNA-binding LacI/PurR family transcriptional regulator
MPQRKSGHVTLSDVARSAGFAVSTVSIVLSEAPLSKNVSTATREHIRKTAARLGYHPDAFARSLRKRTSQTIGVLAFDLSDPFCMPIVGGIQSGLQSTGFLPLVMNAQTQRKLFDSSLALLLERRVDGVIVIASWVFEEAGLLTDMRKNNVPILIVGRDLTHQGITSILLDNWQGGYIAMRYLIDLGHRRIAVILGPEEMFDSQPRWEGIQQAAVEKGVELDPTLIFQLPGKGGSAAGFDGGRHFTCELLAEGESFSAVLAFDDLTALGVLRALSEAGIRVPDDCSVMGFDDVLPARVCTPAITTVSQPLHSMGLQAADGILKALQQSSYRKARLMKLPPELVVRMSTSEQSPQRGLERSRSPRRV